MWLSKDPFLRLTVQYSGNVAENSCMIIVRSEAALRNGLRNPHIKELKMKHCMYTERGEATNWCTCRWETID